jgi:ligand-binding sensor domain-containing protein
MAADPVQGIWIANSRQLSYLNGVEAQVLSLPEPLYYRPAALLVDTDDRVWIGSERKGVWAVTLASQPGIEPHWQEFVVKDGRDSKLVTALARGPDGRIYAAHHAGVSVFDPTAGIENGHWDTLLTTDVRQEGWVNAMTFPPPHIGDELWAGNHHGTALRRYRDGRWEGFQLPLSGERDYSGRTKPELGIGALLVDDQGTLWIGTTQGLWRWPAPQNGAKPNWEQIDPQDLVVYNVLALAQDAQGRIWVGGDEGVAMLEQ